MSGYLETKTAEKLQLACDSITRACTVYEIAQLHKLGFITENIAKGRLEAIGVRFGNEETKVEQARKFIPTRIFAKMLGIAAGEDWFWYSHDIFTTSGPDGLLKEQSVHIDTALAFLHRNERFARKVLNFEPKTEEELYAWSMLNERLI